MGAKYLFWLRKTQVQSLAKSLVEVDLRWQQKWRTKSTAAKTQTVDSVTPEEDKAAGYIHKIRKKKTLCQLLSPYVLGTHNKQPLRNS